MAESKLCAGCRREDEENNAGSWCIDCSEPVCRVCAKFHEKLAPPHKVVEMSEVDGVTSNLLKMSENCNNHPEEKVALFCCQHDSVICDVCLSQTHKTCKPILSLKKAAEGVKLGTAITDLEKRIKDAISVIERKSKVRPGIAETKTVIQEKIRDMKNNIIKHLDKLEKHLLEEVEETCQNMSKHDEITPISFDLASLRQWETDLKYLRENASDIHLFQVVKILDKNVHQTEQEISTSKLSVIPVIQFTPSEFADNFKNIIQSIGIITTRKPEFPVPTLEIEQRGQASVDTTDVTRMSSFKTSKLGEGVEIFRGCFISASRLFLSQYFDNFIHICDSDGTNSKSIWVDFRPGRIVLYNSNTVMILGQNCIQSINLPDLTLGKKIMVGMECWGMGCRDGKIWIRSDRNTITAIDISGKVQKKIRTTFNPWDISVHQSGDLYCTDMNTDSVYVVTPEGKERVVYRSDDLRGTDGIAIDKHGYIYVAGRRSNNIYRISPNGMDHTAILTEENDITNPEGLAFNEDTNELMVINDDNTSIYIYKT